MVTAWPLLTRQGASRTDGAPSCSTGNEMTPSSKYDFKFKDYAPWVFRSLRKHFHIDASDYLVQ